MEKRYQVFLSSTYADLREERSRVLQVLMEMDCIPAGMELFPAADEEQWQFIGRVIDDCDYYVLIIGGRYGSLTPQGVSYTEREYDYALGKNIPVLAFLHEQPEQIPVGKSDIDPEARAKLETFRTKVSQGRLVKFWKSAEELPGLVALSLSKTIKTHPAVGWIRASAAPTNELLSELNEVRKRNSEIEAELSTLRAQASSSRPLISDLAPLSSKVAIAGHAISGLVRVRWSVNLTWNDLFAMIAPYILEHPNDGVVKQTLSLESFKRSGKVGVEPEIEDDVFQTIKVQLMAQALVNVQYLKTTQGGMALFWSLTRKGVEALMTLRTVRQR